MTRTMPAPPVAPRKPHAITQHSHTRSDDYFWLRERDNPEVLAYLQAENAYTEAMMAHTQALQQQLFLEMKGRIKETDMSAPEKDGEFVYYGREVAGKQYSIRCRKRAQPDAIEEMLLDENTLAEGHAYFRVGLFEVSPDHRWLAYATDTDGDEVYTLHIKNLETGEVLPERIPNVYYSAEWADDNRTLFYTVLDEAKRPYKVFRHIAGADPTEDLEVFHEPDTQFFVNIGKSSSKRYLIITLSAFDNGEVHTLRADQPDGAFTCFHPRQKGVEYTLDHHAADGQSGRFFIHTNEDALNFKLMTASEDDPARDNWREFLPNRPDVYLEFKLLFKDYIVRFERESGMRRVRITDARGQNEREVAFPEPAYAVHPMGNREFDAHTLRFAYQSMVTPWQVVDYDLRTGAWAVMKAQEIPSSYERSQYRTERLEAIAPDGKRVPISLAYKADTPLDGSAPLLLYGYGSYGASMEPWFSTRILSLLDRGVIYAIAHIRGGAEMGRAWYEDGRLLHKRNTFTDFIACAEHLVAQRYTSPKRLAAWGASAGGLLIGAITNMRPDLFKAVVAEVPFVDVINTMSDASIPLTAGEWDQWGNPANKTYFDYMLSYSPYDNIEAKAYPDILAIAGLNDPRVQYWEPAKWAAKLRATKTDDNWLLLKTHMSEGHGGASGRYDALKEEAFTYAFLLDRLTVSR
jgi:oligopeptidase B